MKAYRKGHPIDITRAFQSRAAEDCPPLEKGANVKDIICNGATCVLKCESGFLKVGRGRTRCRFHKQKGFFWGGKESFEKFILYYTIIMILL